MDRIEQPPTDAADAKGSGAPVQSVERAFRILETVSRHPNGVKLADLSKEVGLHNSTVFHLVKSLAALGYLRQEESGKRYKVGRGIFSIASACFEEHELVDVAMPLLRELADGTGESSHFAVWSRDQVLILARSQGQSAFTMAERIGSLRPAHATAIGKVLLSGLSERKLEDWFQRNALASFTPATQTDAALLRPQVAKVRAEGIAYDDCEYNAEARCIAAPVRNFTGAVIGAVGISGPVWRLSLQEIGKHANLTRAIGARLSRELGWQG